MKLPKFVTKRGEIVTPLSMAEVRRLRQQNVKEITDEEERQIRRERVEKVLGKNPFNPYDRNPTEAEIKSLERDGLTREFFMQPYDQDKEEIDVEGEMQRRIEEFGNCTFHPKDRPVEAAFKIQAESRLFGDSPQSALYICSEHFKSFLGWMKDMQDMSTIPETDEE